MGIPKIIKTRRANVLRLIRERFDGSQSSFAVRAQISLSQLGQWLADEDSPHIRNMSERSARKIEKNCSLPERWLDIESDSDMQGVTDSLSTAEYMGRAPKQALIPVAGLAKLGSNGWYEEVSAPGAEGYVEATSSDPDAYVLLVKGDSMHPAIRNGWYVVVEPNRSPVAGEYAAIMLRDGRKMVKEFLFSATDTITVESVNGGERLSLQREDVKVIHAIGSVLMPSKHRDL